MHRSRLPSHRSTASPRSVHSAASQPSCHQSRCFRVLSWNRFCHPDFHHRPSRALNADLSENYELVRSFRKLLLGSDPATIARILPKLRKRSTDSTPLICIVSFVLHLTQKLVLKTSTKLYYRIYSARRSTKSLGISGTLLIITRYKLYIIRNYCYFQTVRFSPPVCFLLLNPNW